MSFATYKSPFDEAMSKPLISDDTQSVTRHSHACSESNQSRTGPGNSITSDPTRNNKPSSSSSSSSSSSAFNSKKLPLQNPFGTNTTTISNTTTKPPPESFFKFNIDQKNESSFEDEYQPPNLTLETTTTESFFPEQGSLEAALIRERNEESRSILQKMTTISAISSELNSLVYSQQDTVDEMEEHAYMVHDSAERGVSELENANNMMQKNNGSGVEVFWRVFFGVIGFGGLIVALVIFLHSL